MIIFFFFHFLIIYLIYKGYFLKALFYNEAVQSLLFFIGILLELFFILKNEINNLNYNI